MINILLQLHNKRDKAKREATQSGIIDERLFSYMKITICVIQYVLQHVICTVHAFQWL